MKTMLEVDKEKLSAVINSSEVDSSYMAFKNAIAIKSATDDLEKGKSK